MQNLFQVLSDPSEQNLRRHEIQYFDAIIAEFPAQYKKIISYINECYNYQSDLIVEEKDWGKFLQERFRANHLPEEMRSQLIEFEYDPFTIAINEFLDHQKESTFQTLVAKQQLRQAMLKTIQNFSASTTDKKTANELLTNLDDEINAIHERMRSDQKKLGNYKGYDKARSAKAKTKINMIDFVKDRQ